MLGPIGCKKLSGAEDLWRLRVGDYRVVYRIDDDKHTVDVTVVRHRREVYR
jgi:mRNA interferase RelE/StbE